MSYSRLLSEKVYLLAEPADLLLETDPGVDAVRGDATGLGQGRLRQGDRVDDGGTDTAWPVGREGDLGLMRADSHRSPGKEEGSGPKIRRVSARILVSWLRIPAKEIDARPGPG